MSSCLLYQLTLGFSPAFTPSRPKTHSTRCLPIACAWWHRTWTISLFGYRHVTRTVSSLDRRPLLFYLSTLCRRRRVWHAYTRHPDFRVHFNPSSSFLSSRQRCVSFSVVRQRFVKRKKFAELRTKAVLVVIVDGTKPWKFDRLQYDSELIHVLNESTMFFVVIKCWLIDIA